MKVRKFSHQIVNRIPWTGGMTRDKFDESIAKELCDGFRRELTHPELCLFDAAVSEQKSGDAGSAALAAWLQRVEGTSLI
jgi:hypothetical protein